MPIQDLAVKARQRVAADSRLDTQRGHREQPGRTVCHRQRERDTMSADEEGGDDDEVIITVPADQQAGVWANWARVNEGDHEFTIDFARVDQSVTPEVGVVVARIGMSPQMLRLLLDRIEVAWSAFADNLAEELRDRGDDDH
jgi:hypothetical protein